MYKSRMIAIKRRVTVDVVVFYEAVAKNVKEALKDAKEYSENMPDSEWLSAAIDEIKIGGEVELKQIHVVSCGLASQYHDISQCKLCQKVDKFNKAAKE